MASATEVVPIVPGTRLAIPFHLGSIAFPLNERSQTPAPSSTPPTAATSGGGAASSSVHSAGRSNFEWHCYIRPATADQPCLSTVIERVVFVLGKGFAKPTREVRRPPFVIAEVGWANAHIDVEVYFKSAQGDDERSLSTSKTSSSLAVIGGDDDECGVDERDAVPAPAQAVLVAEAERHGPFGKLVLHHEVKLRRPLPPAAPLLTAAKMSHAKLAEQTASAEVGVGVVSEREDTFLFVDAPQHIIKLWTEAVHEMHASERGRMAQPSRKGARHETPARNSKPPPPWPPLDERLWAAILREAQLQGSAQSATPNLQRRTLEILRGVKRDLLTEQRQLTEGLTEADEANKVLLEEIRGILAEQHRSAAASGD